MAKPKASLAKSDLEHPSIESYKPGQLVLSKARNYPPWPAVVSELNNKQIRRYLLTNPFRLSL